jgi:anti-sigma regulatory factor (Ser/Thr protein kinase)
MDEGGRLARLEIEPDRSAPSAARHWAREALDTWDLASLCEDVEMVLGELVVNVVLHAGTPAEVVLRPSGAGVRLEVTDHRPEFLPAEASTGLNALFELDEEEGIAGVTALDVETTTGRGLRLVAAVSHSWGVVPGDGVKTVWAQIGGPAAETDEGSNDSILDLEPVDPAAAPPGAALIRMAGVPTRLVLTSAANLDDLVREFRMAGSGSDALHGDLSELAESFLAMTTNVRQPFRDAALAAIEDRRRLLDVAVAVPPTAGPTLRAFRDVLDQIVYYCRQGELLSLAPDDEIIAFRRWYVDEIERQIAGASPRACPFAVLPADDPALTPAGDVPGPRPPRPGWLERAAGSLDHAHDVASIAFTAINAAANGVGAASGSLCLLEDDGLTVRLVTAVAYRQEIEGEWRTFGVGDDVPASECIRTGEPILLRTLEERTIRYPIFGVPSEGTDHGLACLPVERGCLVIGYAEPRPFDEEEQRGLMQLAYLVNEALIRIAGPGRSR